MDKGVQQMEKLASTEATVKLIFQEVKFFRKEMKEEIEKLGEMFKSLLKNSVAQSQAPTRHSEDESGSDSSLDDEDTGSSCSEVSNAFSDTNEVIDITDFFDDLEVPQADPFSSTVSSSAIPTPSSNPSFTSTSKICLDVAVAKTEPLELPSQIADNYSSSSDSEKSVSFSTCGKNSHVKSETNFSANVKTKKPTVKKKEKVVSTIKQEAVSSTKVSLDVAVAKTEPLELPGQTADDYSSSSDSEKSVSFSTCSENSHEKSETKFPADVKAKKPTVKRKEKVASTIKQEAVSSTNDSINLETPNPIQEFKNNVNGVTPKMLNDFLSASNDTVKKHHRTSALQTECNAVSPDQASMIPIGIIVDPDTGGTIYECPFCHRNSKNHRDIQRHMVIHTGVRRFKCIFCSKAFKRGSHMRCHMRTHTGERPFKCSKCNKTYVNKIALKAHEILHEKKESRQKEIVKEGSENGVHGTRERPHRCVYCERLFRQKGHLTKHISNTHLREKDFHCIVCTKTFARKEHVIRHMRSHTGEKPYQCPTCPARFSDTSSLRKHRISVHR